jgi:hypothetical protein
MSDEYEKELERARALVEQGDVIAIECNAVDTVTVLLVLAAIGTKSDLEEKISAAVAVARAADFTLSELKAAKEKAGEILAGGQKAFEAFCADRSISKIPEGTVIQ